VTLDRQLKLPFSAVGERKVCKVAAELQSSVVGCTGHETAADPAAKRERQSDRQVTVHFTGLGSTELCRQIDDAGPAHRGTVLAARRPGQRRIGKGDLVERERRLSLDTLPFHAALKTVEQKLLVERSRQIDRDRA